MFDVLYDLNMKFKRMLCRIFHHKPYFAGYVFSYNKGTMFDHFYCYRCDCCLDDILTEEEKDVIYNKFPI